MTMTFGLRSKSTAQDLLVDVAVHFVKKRGVTGAKVFKVTRLVLAPRARVECAGRFSLAVHTTRMPRPGKHAVDILVNGHAMRVGSFEVIPEKKAFHANHHERRRRS